MIATKYLLVIFLYMGPNTSHNAGGVQIIDKAVFDSKAQCEEAASISTSGTSQVATECIPWGLVEKKS